MQLSSDDRVFRIVQNGLAEWRVQSAPAVNWGPVDWKPESIWYRDKEDALLVAKRKKLEWEVKQDQETIISSEYV
jgi:hypothetical protein